MRRPRERRGRDGRGGGQGERGAALGGRRVGRRGAGLGGRGHGHDAAGLVQAVLLEEAMQGHARDRHAPGAADEVEQVVAGRRGVVVEELGDRAGEARQELAVGAAGEAVVGGLHHLLGGEALLSRGGGTTEAEQTGDLGHFEAGLRVQEEVAEQAAGEIVAAALLEEAKGRAEDSTLLGGQSGLGNGAVLQPTGEGRSSGGHGRLGGAAGDKGRVWRRS